VCPGRLRSVGKMDSDFVVVVLGDVMNSLAPL